MIPEKSLAVYKNRPALVRERGEKIVIAVLEGERAGKETLGEYRVRDKDLVLLHPGPVQDFSALRDPPAGDVRGAWELLLGAGGAAPLSLRELAELAYGAFTPASAWATYGLLLDGLYFTGTVEALNCRGAEEVAGEERRRLGKRRDLGERNAFLERLRAKRLELPEDRRFLQDAEALALGKTAKSRTLKDLGLAETPQNAHRLLLDTGVWTVWINPHPARFDIPPGSAQVPLDPPPEEERLDLTDLPALAIDNAWSADPDDAVSLEGPGASGHAVLWVHVADPAAAVRPGSPADLEARGRGATLYLPEGPLRMLADEALTRYALGLEESSPALSFKIVLDGGGSIVETSIVRSRIRVSRMSYEEADAAVREDTALADTAMLAGIFRIAERNLERRLAAGAVSIEMPETHIAVSIPGGEIRIEALPSFRSAAVVRECMLLAGEGAARWALQNRLPFPYVTQEAGDLPNEPLPGLAGFYQIRRCMRPRSLSAKPGIHRGLGLDGYTQVTSPLRRYTDLLAHQQIRAFLRGEAPLGEEEVLRRLAAGEAAAAAVNQAERASKTHWTAVYLAREKALHGRIRREGVVVEKKGARAAVIIPALGIETQAALKQDTELNEPVSLELASVRIPEGEFTFVPA
ncbi:MAG: RNB domain-containing ribonuclease [Treponema sp.]|nr:RNB domain-containing ribonuclease [Treponema sp.]